MKKLKKKDIIHLTNEDDTAYEVITMVVENDKTFYALGKSTSPKIVALILSHNALETRIKNKTANISQLTK